MPIRDLILHLREQKSGHALLDAADDLDKAAKGMDKFGDSSRATKQDLAGLRAEIDRSTRAAKDLRLQIARTGDKSLFGDLRKEESNLRRFQKLLTDMDPGKKGGGLGGLIGGIPSIGGVPGPVVAGLGAAAVVLSPAIGATVAAAVVGGVGTGGVIGGVVLAAQDTRVKSAFKDVGREIFEGLGDSASPFVGPLVNAASMFGDAWRKEAPEFRQNFATLAEAVKPLAEGLTGFVHNLGPGLGALFTESIPLAKEFGKDFAEFGGDVSDFLFDMSRSAPGAKAALHDLFEVTGAGLDALGDGIEILSETYEWANKLGMLEVPRLLIETPGVAIQAWRFFNPELEKSVKNFNDSGGAAEGLTRELEDQADAAERNERNLKALTKAVDEYYDGILGRLDAAERYEAAIDELTESVAQNGRTLDIHTKQGRENRDAVEEVATAIRGEYEAGLLTEEQYRRKISLLEQQAVKLGMNEQAVQALVGEFQKVPSQIKTDLVMNLITSGNSWAWNVARSLFGLKSIPAPTTAGFPAAASVNIHASQQMRGFASGGRTPAFEPFRVHDNEILFSSREHYVATAAQARGMGGGAVTVEWVGGPTDELGRALLGWLQKQIRITAGGNVQKALGQ